MHVRRRKKLSEILPKIPGAMDQTHLNFTYHQPPLESTQTATFDRLDRDIKITEMNEDHGDENRRTKLKISSLKEYSC